MRKLKLLLVATALLGVSITASAQDAGTYYIQNMSNGKWLGPANNWASQASVKVDADYWKLAKQSDGAFTLESVVSNGGTSYYLNGTYCDGSATNFTFTAIAGKENTYSIANSSGGYLTTNGTTVDVSASDASSDASQWKLWSEADMTAALNAATIETPANATYLIKDYDIRRHHRYQSSWSITNAVGPKTNIADGGTAVWSIEAYKKSFDVNQTLSGIPNGVYAVRVNGFYRQDGTDNNLPYVYAGDSKTTLPARTGTENDMQEAAVSFVAGNYLSDPAYVQVTNGSLKIGVATIGTSCWTIFKNFHLYYYGNVSLTEVLLHEYVQLYNAALAGAKEYQDDDMFDVDKTALNNAIDDNTIDLSGSVTEEQLTTATNNLNVAIVAAQKAVVKYTTYNNIVTAVTGKTNVDITSLIANLGFEDGNLNAWTSDNGGNVATNANFSGKVGTYFVERWQSGVALGSGSLTHDLLTLPAGVYTITANAQNIEQYNNGAAGTGYFLCVNSDIKEIGAAGNYSITVKYTGNTDATIKFLLDNCTGNWISCDNVTVTYVGEDFPAVTLVDGKMNGTVADAQTAAKAAYDTDASVANYNALVDAIAAAQSSKDAYTSAAAALTLAETNLNSTNVYTAAARKSFSDAIDAAQAAYDDNSMTTETATALNATLNRAEWGKTPAPLAADYIGSAWTSTVGHDRNFWSWEGDADNSSGMSVPFIQAYVGDDSKLPDNIITGTVSDLANGLYNVTALVRVVNKKESPDDGYAGISLQVNDGDATEFADATEYTDGYATSVTAEGLVKDGILNIKLIISGTNASWVAFKNVNYTKVRDLTQEEEAVAPTAIALFNGDDEVTAPINLNATSNTVTLTPSYTPAEATEGYITWTSSDETVATVAGGVVTGVAPGTATITATSTLNAEVSATATVTVTYPEAVVPDPYYVNNEAARTVYTLGENLIKNGSFEYPNALYGWTVKNTYTEAANPSNFTITTTGGVDNGTYVTTNAGGASAATSLSKAIAVEKGKTYYFSVYTSGKAPANKSGSMNWQYNALFALSSATSESGTIKVFEWPQGAENTTSEWNKTVCVFEATTDYVGVRMSWNGGSKFDEFVLAEVVNTETVGNVDYAIAAIPTANIGTAAFQYSQTAIAAANALVQGTATVDDVVAAYDAVTTLNAPADGQLYNVVNITSGFAHAGKALTFKAASDADLSKNTTSMAWEAAPGYYMPQGVKFTAVDGTKNGYKLSYTRADGNEIYISTGTLSGLGDNNNQIRPTTDAAKALTFVVTSVGDNHWHLLNTAAGKNVGSNGNTSFYTAEGSNKDMRIQEAVNNEVALNITAANQYGTLILPFDADLPTGVVAYSVSNVEGKTLTLAEAKEGFKANTPYIVFAENGINETLAGLGAAYTDATYTAGLLTGTYTQMAAPNGSYILQNQNGVVAFYQVNTDEAQPNVPANRAYLTYAGGAGARAFFFPGSEATGISAIGALTSGQAEIYDEGGRKQQSLKKGLNIIRTNDGKTVKVVVK